MQYESIYLKVTDDKNKIIYYLGIHIWVILKKSKGKINLKFETVVTPRDTRGPSMVLVIF